MPKWRIAVLGVVAVPLLLFGVTSAAWAIDTRDDSDRAARGVEVAGTDLGGKTEGEVRAAVEELAAELPDTVVTIDADDLTLETTAAELGVAVDVERTVDAVMAVGRDDPGPLAPLRWARAFIADRRLPVRLSTDRARAVATLERLEGDRRTTPVEPTIEADEEGVRLVAGKDGIGLDIDGVLADLPESVDDVGGEIDIDAERVTTTPRISDDDVEALARTAEANTAEPIAITVGDTTRELDATRLRGGFRVSPSPEGPRLSLDPEAASLALVELFPTSSNPTGVRFDLVGGRPVPTGGIDVTVCCTPEAPQALTDAILTGQRKVTLGARTMTAAEGVQWASTLGVAQKVASFTTSHPAGQPRVKNIHRISDLTRGVLIPPGSTFSVNDFVGRRTAEKGFVVAPVIEDGEFTEDVGGGVSQYATTLFNAAFFGGLDIPEYKAHSVYISRYPFGREATLAYPGVDLKLRNNTPYGVVIWPTYTARSITVDLYSTPYAIGAQTAQRPTSGCGRVSTTRTRTFVDGRTDSQVFRANYDCDPPDH